MRQKDVLERIEEVFGVVTEEHQEEAQMGWFDEQDDVVSFGPILPKKGVRMTIDSAESTTWTVKEEEKGGAPGHTGEAYPAMKLTCTITDPTVQTEGEHIRPRLTIEYQTNLAKYPFLSKKTGEAQWMGRTGLYGLEESLGFDPIYVNGSGQPVPPFITKDGRKRAPRGENIKRQLNPEFFKAYFHPDGTPNLEWAGKTVFANVEVERSEKFGDRNTITQFVAEPKTL